MVVTFFSGRSNPLRQLFTGQPKGGSTTSVTALTPPVESLREQRPQVYAEEAHYCLQWRLALLAGKEIDLVDLVEVRGDTNVLLLTLMKTSR